MRPACCLGWLVQSVRHQACTNEPFQVPRLGPGVEERLLTLFRNRILPMVQKNLRLWKKGDVRCRGPPHAVWHNALGRVYGRACTWMPCTACVALVHGTA